MSTTPEPVDRTPNRVRAALGRALEAALDRVLALDPETRAAIAKLDGRALTVTIRDTPLAIRLTVDGERLRVGPAVGDSQLRVAATPGAFLALLLMRAGDGDLPPGRVEIAGDAELARRLERIAKGFEPDFDAAFTGVFGDVVGFQIARGVRRALAWGRESADSLARDTAEYLSEESRDVVSGPEVEQFLDDVDALRERSDRLEARVRQLLAEQPAVHPQTADDGSATENAR